VLFDDMDQTLREMGVGDLSVGKKIRSMSEAFYGRVAAYEKGLQAGGDAVLIAALERNLFRGNAPEAEKLQRLAAYVRSADNALARRFRTMLPADETVGVLLPASVGATFRSLRDERIRRALTVAGFSHGSFCSISAAAWRPRITATSSFPPARFT
jgi:hypothetical protein